MSELLKAALDYARRGWPVLPIWWPETDGSCACWTRAHASTVARCKDAETTGKHPTTRHGLIDATTIVDTIEAWWTRYPDANVGLRTGVAFDVLDVDGPPALDGIAAVAQAAGIDACVREGALIVPDSPSFVWNGPEVITGRGFHRYVLPSGRGNSKPSLDKLDYRGAGGYVIAPPSLHATGHRYTWAIGGPDVTLEPLPDWCDGFWHRGPTPSPGLGARAEISYWRGPYNASGLVKAVAASEIGNRDNLLHWAAWRVGHDVRAGRCTKAEAVAALEGISAAALGCGLNAAQIDSTMRSGHEAGKAGKGRSPEGGGRHD